MDEQIEPVVAFVGIQRCDQAVLAPQPSEQVDLGASVGDVGAAEQVDLAFGPRDAFVDAQILYLQAVDADVEIRQDFLNPKCRGFS